MRERSNVVVIGAGQAGLATSYELTQAGLEHVVLEGGRLGQAWRDRWDSFCLVTPNWSVQLPGHPYDGNDPDGYLARDAIVEHLERYAAAANAPVREGVAVTSLEPNANESLHLETSVGPIDAATVVVAAGAYQRPHRPPAAAALPTGVLQIDVGGYGSPDELPDGKVLIVGGGQSGCQIAEELHDAGRDVFLSCGRAPWVLRRYGGRDVVWWAVETGFLDQPLSALPAPSARLEANLLASGHGGGHDLHVRTLDAMGVTLLGHFAGVDGRRARFAPDLAATVAWGDERYRLFAGLIRKLVADRGLDPVEIPEPEPFEAHPIEELDLAGFAAVIFAGGFRPDYSSWVRLPGAFDALGFPLHEDGRSAVHRGVYFVGVHFLRKRKSSLLYGVGEDAAIVARSIASDRRSRASSPARA